LGSINGRDFLSVDVTHGGQPRPLVAGTKIRLAFQDGSLTANAGCNTIGGLYQIGDGKLVFTGGTMTEMGCDDGRMAQDDWLIAILGSEPTITLEGDALTLLAGETSISLLDREVAEPDQLLTGRTWTLTSLISGDAVSSVPADVVATLAFGEDGSVDVMAGCNSGGGSYTVDADSISFSDVFTTKMACQGPHMQVENAVLQVISTDGLTFNIDANVLTITAADVGLQFSAN
jgi:heat shock protein HslJ